MAVQLGPVSATYLPKVEALDLSGGALTVKGKIKNAPDVSVFAGLAAQLRSLTTAIDAPEIPVVFSGAEAAALSHLNGFYTVSSSSVTPGQGALAASGTVEDWRWSVTLVPVADRNGPRIESILESVLRQNSVSITAATSKVDPWHAVPAGSGIYDDGAGQDLNVGATISTDTGDIRWGRDSVNNPPRRTVSAWSCPPASWYQGAAIVERKWGLTWLPVVGRDPGLADGDWSWRISNGLFRLSPQAGDPSSFDLECWRSSGGWQSTTTIRLPVLASPPYSPTRYVQALTMSILRNSPAEVRVRIMGQISGSVPPSIVDLRLRRGQPWVDLRWAMPNSTTGLGIPDSLSISPAPSWSAISGGGGRVATADANGNKLVQFYPVASSNSSGTSWDTAIGWEISGWPLDNTYLKGQYFAPSAELVRFVGA